MTRWILSLLALALLCGCGRKQQPDTPEKAQATAPAQPAPANDAAINPPLGDPDADGYRELDWSAMLPPAELKALENSDEAPVNHTGKRAMPQTGTYNTVAAVLARKVRLPGYVVPLDSDDAGRVREFLFVPYYGACIHVPPPPPNQIVHVRLDTPIDPPDMYSPFYLSGQLRAEILHGELAGTAYTMEQAQLHPYEKG
ncbi:DUF3299 domain-containing protein [Xanthomonas sacchari]|uniref:DUF3299 domain-containing protein n=1 Tax=Xanthomonas sacchari TaxID=56458 RepID=A0A2P5Z517_9XANT|nr:DUF3299 domain-containing protein [Xanthomonas sacchari]MDV0438261.1 DUF3299 domain-containing protein [Xanthomonas sacchari]PPU83078.1 DUF3299 domain-containing protein [Xanthomonas sacchari]